MASEKNIIRGWAAAPVEIEGSTQTNYYVTTSIHNNSGGLTCDQENGICYIDSADTSMSNACKFNYVVRSVLVEEQEDTSVFDKYIEDECRPISKNVEALSCNFDMLTVWFNADNVKVLNKNDTYTNRPNDAGIKINMKNVDDCKIIVQSENHIHELNQYFDKSTYVDSERPRISLTPCSTDWHIVKYEAGKTYNGHKVKYNICSGSCFVKDVMDRCENLVEIYFPTCLPVEKSYIDPSSANTHNAIETVAASALTTCSALTAITFGSVRYVKESACKGLRKLSFIDWGALSMDRAYSYIEEIGDYAFSGCTSLKNICLNRLGVIHLDNQVSAWSLTIGKGAFKGCTGATSLTLPKDVMTTENHYHTISEECFADCTSLTEVDIPINITKIEKNAFSGCSSLTSVTIQATTPPRLDNANAFSNTNNCPIYVPRESVAAYQAAAIWSSLSSRIQAIPT